MKALYFFVALGFILFFSSCETLFLDQQNPGQSVNGVAPIYAPAVGWDIITATDPQPIEYLGKIYYKDNTIYVNERNRGIHVIDNSDPAAPVAIKFIEVVGSEDIAIKGNILYSDNISDLVAIDISNLDDIKVTKRVKDLYSESKKLYPDGYNGYFECVDPEKGIVIGWEEKLLTDPSCIR